MNQRNYQSNYQSPIILEPFNYIPLDQYINICGINKDAHYNKETHNFEVRSHVYINLNSKTYKLDEYHFHVPTEHIVNGEKHDAEIHYVFIEHEAEHPEKNSGLHIQFTHKKIHSNICSCCEESDHNQSQYYDQDKNIVVIGRTIQNNCISTRSKKQLKNMPIKKPHTYYQYDGTLTTGSFAPVRWIIGSNPIFMDIDQIRHVAKPARPIQELDGRIVLFTKSK
jgi:carbonic anhydrase